MIVDTSAIVALILDEPQADAIAAAILADPAPRMSAPTFVELQAVVTARLPAHQVRRVERLLETLGLTIEPFTADHAALAARALRDYGRGSGHPARLNLGDSFSYALAAATGEPLLFIGDDFTRTDLRSVLAH